MKATLAKFDWLTAQACPAMAWHALRAAPVAPSEADRFRMEQGQEIGALARKFYPGGVMAFGGKPPAEITRDLVADETKDTIFEAEVLAAPFVAKADILRREAGGWHVMEVKSSFSDTSSLDDLVSDLAYTVMVFRRAGFAVTRASLVLLSRQFRFGETPDRLFEIVDTTEDALERAAEFDAAADALAQALFAPQPPEPVLVSACRDCDFFATDCLGRNITNTVFEIPSLHYKKLKRLSDAGIIDLSQVPDDLELNDRQLRAKQAALAGTIAVDEALRAALAELSWPCHYLDFETVATVMPLYQGHGCHQQVLTQFSIHHRDGLDAEPRHSEYLADASHDCQRQAAEALVAALGQEGSIIVYSSFEKTRIKALRNAFPELAGPLDSILERLVDLLKLVTEYVYHPAFRGSFSIKKVLPALVPDLSYENLAIGNGDMAITRFARMARGEITGDAIDATRGQLLEYCELDTLAMLRLHEALHRLSVPEVAMPAGS